MPRKTTQRGPYAKTPRTREAILESAFEVFSRGGYLSSSMTEIAKGAGMTLPGVTNHFPTKAVLLEAVLRQRDIDANVHLEGRIGADMLKGLIAVAARDESDREITRLFAILAAEATTDDHPAHAYFRERYELILNAVGKAFKEAEELGQLKPGVDAVGAAQGYIALSDGAQLQRLYGVGVRNQRELVNGYLENLLVKPLFD